MYGMTDIEYVATPIGHFNVEICFTLSGWVDGWMVLGYLYFNMAFYQIIIQERLKFGLHKIHRMDGRTDGWKDG